MSGSPPAPAALGGSAGAAATGATAPAAPAAASGASAATAPAPDRHRVGVERLHPLRRGWRRLTSMRTALLLLFLLALAAVPGSLLPQSATNPDKVAAFTAAHPLLGRLAARLSLFDVFGAPWFAAIYLLLFVSLVGCLVPRLRLHARALATAPPPAPRSLRRLPAAAGWVSEAGPAAVAGQARAVLRRRGFRTAARTESTGAVSVSAEKGYLRESGNLLFHVALVLLLVAVALGGLFGYQGDTLVVAGGGFSNTLPSYDSFSPGRLFSPGQLGPFTLLLSSFRASYQPSGEARRFDAFVRYSPSPGAPLHRADIRVNSPLRVDGATVYLIGHGYAPQLVVRGPDGRVAFAAAVPFLPQDSAFVSTGVVKVPDVAPGPHGVARQLGFSGLFTPTTVLSAAGVGSSSPAPRDPAVTLLAWQGDLGLSSGRPQSVYSLDTAGLHRLRSADGAPVSFTLRPGQSFRLPGGAGSISFTGYRQWATFQVTHDPGKLPALVAALLIVAGLLLSLRVRRRRFWLRAVAAAPGRTVVEVGGLARTDPEAFADEFHALADRLRPAGKE